MNTSALENLREFARRRGELEPTQADDLAIVLHAIEADEPVVIPKRETRIQFAERMTADYLTERNG